MNQAIIKDRTQTSLVRKIFLISSILLLVCMIPVRSIVFERDHAFGNIALVPFVFFAGLGLYLYLVSKPGLSANQRFFVIMSPVLPIAMGLILFRFEGFTGEMVPTFRLRWQVKPVPAPITRGIFTDIMPVSPLADQYDFTKVRFPQFLGPNRDGKIHDIQLEPDWVTNPPEILWKQPIGEGWSGFAVEGRYAVTMEQRGDREDITCYDVLTGTSLWQRPYVALHTRPDGGTGPRATPAIADGFVFTQGATGIVYCCDLLKGTPQWKHEFIETKPDQAGQKKSELEVAWGRSGSPLVLQQKVYLPIGGEKGTKGRSLAILDAGLGKVLNRNGEDQISYASPCMMSLAGVQQIVMVNESSVTGHAIESGEVLWSYKDWPGQSNGAATVSQPVQIADNQILLSKGYAQGMAVIEVKQAGENWSTKLLWKDPTLLKTKFTTTIVHKGFAYGLSDGILECVDLQTQKQKWKKGRYGQGQILCVRDLLLVTTEGGEIVLVEANPESHNEVARFKVLDDISWNNPALAGPFLLVRNAREAACVRLPLVDGKVL